MSYRPPAARYINDLAPPPLAHYPFFIKYQYSRDEMAC
jgi:hypothetical protein